MSLEFLAKLSNADGIASNEQEVRDVMLEELKPYCDHVDCDGM